MTIDINNYPLVGKRDRQHESTVYVGNQKLPFGVGEFQIIAGPCAVESKEQLVQTIKDLLVTPVTLLRGGIFKPRSSPYSFQGMGEEGLELLEEIRDKYNLPIVVELMSVEQVEQFGTRVDMIQIGARNMQNFDLLRAVGKLETPVLLKRGMSATIEEWLYSAEYIASEGSLNIILCERGIRTFETAYRNTTDINAIAYIQTLTHLPVILDPSHATGVDTLVKPIALAGVAAGAHGLIIESHHQPETALSDGKQSLNAKQILDVSRSATALSNFLTQK